MLYILMRRKLKQLKQSSEGEIELNEHLQNRYLRIEGVTKPSFEFSRIAQHCHKPVFLNDNTKPLITKDMHCNIP